MTGENISITVINDEGVVGDAIGKWARKEQPARPYSIANSQSIVYTLLEHVMWSSSSIDPYIITVVQ